jgi:hypothetical protein
MFCCRYIIVNTCIKIMVMMIMATTLTSCIRYVSEVQETVLNQSNTKDINDHQHGTCCDYLPLLLVHLFRYLKCPYRVIAYSVGWNHACYYWEVFGYRRCPSNMWAASPRVRRMKGDFVCLTSEGGFCLSNEWRGILFVQRVKEDFVCPTSEGGFCLSNEWRGILFV